MLFRPAVLATARNHRAMLVSARDPQGIGAEPDPNPPVVHYRTAGGNIPCRAKGKGWQPQTCFDGDVTCPKCRRFLGVAP